MDDLIIVFWLSEIARHYYGISYGSRDSSVSGIEFLGSNHSGSGSGSGSGIGSGSGSSSGIGSGSGSGSGSGIGSGSGGASGVSGTKISQGLGSLGLLSLLGFSGFMFFLRFFVFSYVTIPNVVIISKSLRFVKMAARKRGCLKMRITKNSHIVSGVA